MIDPTQRARLNLAKLRALVRAHTAVDTLEDRSAGALPAVVETQSQDGFVLLSGGAGLGAALVWAFRQNLRGRLHLIVDNDVPDALDASVVARRATFFALAPVVHRVVGTGLQPALPGPHLPVRSPHPHALAAIEPLRAAGAQIVVEHGVVMAELQGLEIARVVADTDGDGVHLEVGVGRHDRAAAQMMETVLGTERLTSNVVKVVAEHRRADQPPHLLTRLARQRWLRSHLLEDPSIVGATQLTPIEPPQPRENLVERVPALAGGTCTEHNALFVACAVGVDLEAVSIAADGRDRWNPDAELLYVSPAQDHYPAVRDLLDALVRPGRLVALAGDWSD